MLENNTRMLENETIKIIKQRRSNRSYKAEQIKEEELQTVLEAGIYAPYAAGQTWHFTVIQNKDMLNRLSLEAKAAASQMDMGHLRELGENTQFNCLYGAPTLIIVSGKEQFPIPIEADCAAATQNMLLAAESLGIGSCWIQFVLFAFFSERGLVLKEELKIPKGYKPYYSIILGYKDCAIEDTEDRKRDVITYIR